MPLGAHASAHLPGRRSPVLGLIWVVVAGGLGLGPGRAAASPIPARATYETSGTIDSAGVTGASVVRFVGGSGTTAAASPFSLGAFEVDSTSSGAMTRYDRTPVSISYWTTAINGTSTAAPDGTPAAPMVLHGWLSGTVGGPNPPALAVLFDQGLQPDDPRFYQPRPLPPWPAGSSLATGVGGQPPGFLSLNGGQSWLPLDPTAGGMTAVAASVDLSLSVPEPSPLVILLAAGFGLELARRWRRA